MVTVVVITETPIQNKPVASPAAHSLLANGSSGGKMSMGPHHYVPSIPVNINTTQPHYNSLVSDITCGGQFWRRKGSL